MCQRDLVTHMHERMGEVDEMLATLDVNTGRNLLHISIPPT